METVIVVIAVGIMVMASFYMGAKLGQTVYRGETIKLPNPVKAIEEHKAAVQAEKAKTIFETNMANIDTYDGTGLGQRDFE